MAIIVLTLVIPLLGLAILFSDAERQQAPLIPLFYSNSIWSRWYAAIAPKSRNTSILNDELHAEPEIPQTRSFWAFSSVTRARLRRSDSLSAAQRC